jgi:hypothetical protein
VSRRDVCGRELDEPFVASHQRVEKKSARQDVTGYGEMNAADN